jgi:nitrogen fixation protein NifX
VLKIAFATSDQVNVNLHFGGAESLIVYEVSPGEAELLQVGDFIKTEEVGETGRLGLTGTDQDKVLVKLDFLEGCHAVYAASIGTSSIKRLMAAGIQPIIVDNGHAIRDLLDEVSLALVYGGLGWVDKAKAKLPAPVEAPAPAAPPEAAAAPDARKAPHLRLVKSIDELE